METKEIKIEIPEGYEIDKEKSTFENIVFKKKQVVNCWEDLPKVSGVLIDNTSSKIYESGYFPVTFSNKNIFLAEKYAKSALALAQISQLLPYYDTKVNWNKFGEKYVIVRNCNGLSIDINYNIYQLLAFNTYAEAARFLKHNEPLVKDYYMMEN
jgi:hypothetical protein